MCRICDEFGALGCPACTEQEEVREMHRCWICGESFRKDEGTLSKGRFRCHGCDEVCSGEEVAEASVIEAMLSARDEVLAKARVWDAEEREQDAKAQTETAASVFLASNPLFQVVQLF
jgi:formylmethanofuran dehydrogenase subunit E